MKILYNKLNFNFYIYKNVQQFLNIDFYSILIYFRGINRIKITKFFIKNYHRNIAK